MPKKLTYEYVKGKFEEEGYKLLSDEYIGAHSKLDYICPEKHKHYITWASWQQGHKCPYCTDKAKHTIEFIRSEFEKEGYILLDKMYKNNKQKLNYICPERHKHSIRWDLWQQRRRCPYCYGNMGLTTEFIKEGFEKEGYKLISKTYKNSYTKLDYICRNGHKGNITWGSWSQGHKCPICKAINMMGDGNHQWKGGISCEPYCFEWSSKEFKDFIKKRDGDRCLNPDCNSKNPNDLTIHHIDYNKKNCHPNNLITLCKSCNSRANKDRKWHTSWYQAILNKRYGYEI